MPSALKGGPGAFGASQTKSREGTKSEFRFENRKGLWFGTARQDALANSRLDAQKLDRGRTPSTSVDSRRYPSESIIKLQSLPNAQPARTLLRPDIQCAAIPRAQPRPSLREDSICAIWASTRTPLSTCSQHRNHRCGIRDADQRTDLRSEPIWMWSEYAEALADRDKGQDQDCPQWRKLCSARQGGPCWTRWSHGSSLHQDWDPSARRFREVDCGAKRNVRDHKEGESV